MDVQPIILQGRSARLEPLAEAHAADLLLAAADDAIWRYMPLPLPDETAMHGWIEAALADQAAGTALPFAIVDPASGRAIGSTRFMDIRAKDRGVEIGWTWIDSGFQRTAVNTECKFLLLRHAFETLGAIRVQLKTHRLNSQSRRAIERIGAQFEGILRNHSILPDGTYRDSAYYSVIESEWPAVRRHLRMLLNEGGGAA